MSEAEDEPGPWTVVTQVKSNRVVYFTDDPGYEPVMDGDWYYVSVYHGELPQGMTLRNCWRWRFTGGLFSDAGKPSAQPRAQALFDANREALRRILTEKVDAVRAPYAPSCKDGETVRALKREEARAFLALAAGSDGTGPDVRSSKATRFPLLEGIAVARRCALGEAARLVLAKHAEQETVLAETERFREQLTHAIETATTEKQLLEIREWLLDRVYPELTRRFRYRIMDTEPLDLDALLPNAHRHHEVARLKAQLREAVNDARRPLRSDYVRNEEVRRRKLGLARLVAANLAAGRPAEAMPGGAAADLGLLAAYAEGRGLLLSDAADVLLRSEDVATALLDRTERARDRLLARIEAVCTLRDVRAAEKEIAKLTSSAPEPESG